MSKPKYVKDSKQFTVVFQNVVRDVVENDLTVEESVGIVANRQIKAYIEKFTENGIDYISLFFGQQKRDDEEGEDMIGAVEREQVIVLEGEKPNVFRLGDKYNILRSGIERGYAQWETLDDILDESNGYLKDGALTLHVEIRIDCLIGKDGIRRFNFHDPFENAFKIINKKWDSPLYVPRGTFLHHYGYPLTSEPEGVGLVGPAEFKPYAETFLQILNGVRHENFSSFFEYLEVCSLALTLKTDTVSRYCEEWLTRYVSLDDTIIDKFTATHSKCLLKWWLKESSVYREVHKIAETLDAFDEEDIKSEHMKAVVKKFFSLV